MHRLAAWLRRTLADDRIIVFALALTALLTFHVVFQGFQADDHALRGLSLRLPRWSQWSKSPLELFTFYDGTPDRTMSLVDSGFSPWWTDPELRVMFFRPLTSLTHWVDFRVGPPAFAHAQSLVWYLAVVAAAGVFYRRVLGRGWVAGLALVLFAVDHDHGVLIEWISNRNALVAGLFGVLALIAHDRARREDRPAWTLLSALYLALALAGGEAALGAVAYLGAYVLLYDDRKASARIASALPALVVLAAWLAIYRAGHFGAHGSGMYLDPMDSPRAFLAAATSNIPVLLQAELGGLPPDILLFFGRVPGWAVAAALVPVTVALVAFTPLLRERRARFLLAGALASIVPSAATFPSSRLLLMTSLGLLGLVAMVVEGVVDGTWTWRPGPARWAALYTATWIGGGHLVLSPLVGQIVLQQMTLLERVLAGFGEGYGEDPALARERVVVVNPADVFFTYYTAAMRITSGRVAPEKLLVLASGKRAIELERLDAGTLLVRVESGFFRSGTELLTRSPTHAMPEGSRVSLSGVTIEVTRAGADGVPTEAAFHFSRALEDDGLRWFAWRGKTFVPFVLPAIGEKRRIEAQVPSL